jgi:putative FmdB family regulatory protein
MPMYSFSCRSCGQRVELFLSLGELNRGAAACPQYKSKDLEGPLPDAQAPPEKGLACSLQKKS